MTKKAAICVLGYLSVASLFFIITTLAPADSISLMIGTEHGTDFWLELIVWSIILIVSILALLGTLREK